MQPEAENPRWRPLNRISSYLSSALDSDAISTVTPHFWSSNQKELLRIPLKANGSRKSKMTVAKPEVLISQLVG
jgi:hypothetical protein